MSRVTNPLGLIRRTSYGLFAFLGGLAVIAMGGYLVGSWMAWWPIHGKVYVPMWLLGLVGVTFALAGLMLLALGLAGLVNRLRRHHAVDPTTADYPWHKQYVVHNPYLALPAHWLGSLIFILLLVPANWFAFFSGPTPAWMQIMTAVTNLVAIAVIGYVFYTMLRAAKYGVSKLYLPTFPIRVGAPTQIGLGAALVDQLHVTLRYVHEAYVTRGSGEHRAKRLEATALASQSWLVSSNDGRAVVPIQLQWPPGIDGTTHLRADPDIYYWELRVKANTAGINYEAGFPLPVYDAAIGSVRPNPPWPNRPKAKRIPYAFELALPIFVAALWAGFALLAPSSYERTGDQLQSARQLILGSIELRATQPVHGSGMAVSFDPAGQLWYLSKYGLSRDGKQVINSNDLRERFTGKYLAFSSMAVLNENEVWIGTWKGDVFRLHNNEWQWVTTTKALPSRVIKIINSNNKLTVITSKGLFDYQADSQTFVAQPLPQRAKITAHHVEASGEHWLALQKTLYRSTEPGKWQLVSETQAAITSLYSQGDRLWVGTRKGLFQQQLDGVLNPIGPATLWVREITPHHEQILVATWQQGLLIFDRSGSQWLAIDHDVGLPDNAISDLAISPQGRLALALYSEGLVQTNLPRLQGLF